MNFNLWQIFLSRHFKMINQVSGAWARRDCCVTYFSGFVIFGEDVSVLGISWINRSFIGAMFLCWWTSLNWSSVLKTLNLLIDIETVENDNSRLLINIEFLSWIECEKSHRFVNKKIMSSKIDKDFLYMWKIENVRFVVQLFVLFL